jgi:PiT family inorganic phosphate transporter
MIDPMVLFFLTSGLFLGWALGANDAANVFGTAVGTKMVKWKTAAIICSVFVILGALISGGGTSHTLGKLGAISALPGAFMTALSAAIAVYSMTKSGLPVSTSQAIVGAIIGWNLFSSSPTDTGTLTKILSTWIICPVLSAAIAVTLFKAQRYLSRRIKLHMIVADAYTRVALIMAGAFGAYSLGANNIANVVGVFIPAQPFPDIMLGDFAFSSTQQLFLLGGLAIAVGVFTYSKGVMMTVGDNLGRLTPMTALITVLSHSIVLFLFASRGLEAWLAGHGLPTIPLVPVSSSQAVVGAVVGISILQGAAGIRWSVLKRIVAGWVATPLVAGLICFIGLFFLQNVFGLAVI